MNNNFKKIEDIIEDYISWVPLSLTIREVTRINALFKIDSFRKIINEDKTIIDIGCGDGKWWKFSGVKNLNRITGIDISENEIILAKKIINAKCISITEKNIVSTIGTKFDLAIGNCSMEHIQNIDGALKNIYKLVNDNGLFILILPTPDWVMNNRFMSYSFKKFPRLSMSFSGLINGFFQHWHLYNYKVWIELLQNNRFKVEKIHGLGNIKSAKLFWYFLPISFFSFITKIFTNKYFIYFASTLIPRFLKKKISLWISSKLENSLKNPDDSEIFEYLIIAKKV